MEMEAEGVEKVLGPKYAHLEKLPFSRAAPEQHALVASSAQMRFWQTLSAWPCPHLSACSVIKKHNEPFNDFQSLFCNLVGA